MPDPKRNLSDLAANSDPDLTRVHATTPKTGSIGPNTKLGRYVLGEALGAGGMGVVYRAHDERLQRDVAIKLLPPGLLHGEEARSRFNKEALALAKLSHPHIAAVYDVGEQEFEAEIVDYIVMECVPGQSLAARLTSGPLALKEAVTLALQIAQALEEAHEQGVVHRDLKPANVMITPKGHAKVLDFGLAKLLSARAPDATASITEAGGIAGTPLYMSPEQASGASVDARTDLWSLGVLFYESLIGARPFTGASSLAVLRAISDNEPTPIAQLRPDLPPALGQIVSRALVKDRDNRYQSASAMEHDLSELLAQLSSPSVPVVRPSKPVSRALIASIACVIVLVIAAGIWFFHRLSQRNWAQVEAVPRITDLLAQRKPLAAFALLDTARKILPSDPRFQQIATENSTTVSITSDPAGAVVEIQDYSDTSVPWHRLGTTPISSLKIPKGYFRWKLSKPGTPDLIAAPITSQQMEFSPAQAAAAPAGMVFSPSENWTDYIDFIGWLGPYKLPAYYIDRFEVTNAEYQRFVDSGGYNKKELWPEAMDENGHPMPWSDALAKFRDSTGRPAPSTWAGGHYPEGKADFPVSGVSWYEASAYAAFMGKTLPVMAQFFQAAPPDVVSYTMQLSNISTAALAPVGKNLGLGPFGTYDMAGNVREWVANPINDGSRYILGGSWKSPVYASFDPGALSPFDRSDTNGFRCVRNLAPLPAAATATINHVARDFTHFKPVSDDVFSAYKVLYDYAKTPLNAKSEGIVNETVDWREEKVSFDAAYRGERMAAYLFLPKNVHGPFQTVLFFPSARVNFLDDSKNGLGLGDLEFVDYVIQSGRALLYPIYQDTYERRVKFTFPGGAQNIQITTDRYKDIARSLDYLATRPDIDSTRLAYLGVSMGSAEGVIATELLQDRLKTAVFLDGGYFLETPPPGGDQAEFAVRMKKPVLMVNGRYDFSFSVEQAQNPLFRMLGSPDADKSHILLDTSHNVTEQRPQLVEAVLPWLDKYLGRVNGN